MLVRCRVAIHAPPPGAKGLGGEVMPLAIGLECLAATAERRDMFKPVVPSILTRQLHVEAATSAIRAPTSACQGRTYTLDARGRALQDEIMSPQKDGAEAGKTPDACAELHRISTRLYDLAVKRGDSYLSPFVEEHQYQGGLLSHSASESYRD